MHAENLLHDQYDGEVLALGRHCAVGGDFTVFYRDFHFAGGQALGVGGDRRLRLDGLDGERETGAERGHDELAPRDFGHGRKKAHQFFLHKLSYVGFLLVYRLLKTAVILHETLGIYLIGKSAAIRSIRGQFPLSFWAALSSASARTSRPIFR